MQDNEPTQPSFVRLHGSGTFQLESWLHVVCLLASPLLNLNPGRQVKVTVRVDDIKEVTVVFGTSGADW